MTQLVEDLLLLARTDTGAVDMPLSPIDVRDVVRDVCAEVRGLAEVRRIRVTSSFCDREAVISGNRAGLHRLFLVLLDNAIKYSNTAGNVIVTVESAGERVSVSIEDFGCGIAAAEVPNIFRRFYRADAARSGRGYGIGLALADSIARAHQTGIEVRSEPGHGSRFAVHFAARTPGSAAAADLSANLQLKSLR
jgi:signal transduction histidine kinase